MRRRTVLAIAIGVMALLPMTAGRCLAADEESPSPEQKVHVFVSILPQACFVERVGGERVQVDVMVGPGQSPETYELMPKQMVRLAAARAFFRIGVPFEESLLKKIAATMPNLHIVDTRKGITLRVMEHSHHHHAEHGEDAEDDHDTHGNAGESEKPEEQKGTDPHIWLSPRLVKIQARTICDELVRLDPAHESEYRDNLKRFESDLDDVDRKVAEALSPLKGSEFFVFHPAYGYFGDAYGLRQVPVEVEGKEPSARQLVELIEKARKAGVKVIFVQPQFSTTAAETVARSIGGAVVPLDPLARDYLANLTVMAEKIGSALKPSDNTNHDRSR
ncbi:MAG: zinc ABC transporter substrate-binding protein [Planctomycetes bacterium]|nr:zinc ABC transporter substrate-binding protein [Planctomycetota bacterium]